jgi:hypothetical protein
MPENWSKPRLASMMATGQCHRMLNELLKDADESLKQTARSLLAGIR